MNPSNYSPVYCSLYPELAELFREYGYALAIHGSMARDFDLIAVPWTRDPGYPDEIVRSVCRQFAFTPSGDTATKEHGRVCYTLVPTSGHGYFLDLSFMPRVEPPHDHSLCCVKCKQCQWPEEGPCPCKTLCGDCWRRDDERTLS